MIGIVIVSHGRLANELIAVAEHVVGPQENVVPICIAPEEDMEQCRENIMAAVAEVNRGDGAVILTDMFGGTPSNLAISVMEPGVVEVVAGINVPMLVKLLSVRESMPLEQATTTAQEAGRKYINIASNLLKKGK
jgi:PTS system mannose-specific IIA component